MEDIFLPIKFKASVQLTPAELIPDFEKIILIKLQRTLEGTCSRFGYIKKNSIEIIRRSFGQFMKQHFNGYTNFDVLCKGLVCNPIHAIPPSQRGTIVKARVINKKPALGIHAESQLKDGTPVLDIIVPNRSAGIESERDLEEINIGDEIFIEVLGKRFQMNDTKISIIGRILKDDSYREFSSYSKSSSISMIKEPMALPAEPESDLEEIEDDEEDFVVDENENEDETEGPTNKEEESESEEEEEELEEEEEASEEEYDNPEGDEY